MAGPICMGVDPQLIVCEPAHRSILLTIEIVIDLAFFEPLARRSYLLSFLYWKGKHSWCYTAKCSLLGCSVGAMCLALPPSNDWWYKFWVHTYSNTSHLLISGWRLTCLIVPDESPPSSDVLSPAPRALSGLGPYTQYHLLNNQSCAAHLFELPAISLCRISLLF